MEAFLLELLKNANTALLVILVAQLFDIKQAVKDHQTKISAHFENHTLHCSPEKMTTHLRIIKDTS